MTARTASRPLGADLAVHLRRARDHIDRHYAAAARPRPARRASPGVSKYHFVRCFEATYGETPIRYLTRRRIERAQDLLRHANLTVTEICMLVGFASLGSFSSRFTELVGESPRPTGTGGRPAAGRTCPAATCSCAACSTSAARPASAIAQSERSAGRAGRPTVAA